MRPKCAGRKRPPQTAATGAGAPTRDAHGVVDPDLFPVGAALAAPAGGEYDGAMLSLLEHRVARSALGLLLGSAGGVAVGLGAMVVSGTHGDGFFDVLERFFDNVGYGMGGGAAVGLVCVLVQTRRAAPGAPVRAGTPRWLAVLAWVLAVAVFLGFVVRPVVEGFPALSMVMFIMFGFAFGLTTWAVTRFVCERVPAAARPQAPSSP